MSSQVFRSFIFSMGLFSPLHALAESWSVDPSHSSVGFEVDHMMISTVRGNFGNFTGTFETTAKGKLTSMVGAVNIGSVDTNDPKRDGHLQAPDFFDMENFPTMNFLSTKISGNHQKGYIVTGDLTIRGITKSTKLTLAPIKGPITDGWGNTKVGTVATTTINRQDFGVSWNSTLDAGGLVVGDDVLITLDLQLVQAK
jgi:polyisoprenoid-binding protein YceI